MPRPSRPDHESEAIEFVIERGAIAHERVAPRPESTS